MKFAVCIPTMNASRHWPGLAASLHSQTMQPREVIVLDSSSTDGTAQLATASGARVVSIKREEFRHGGTRQLAAQLATEADLLLYMTQDSILADRDSVRRLLDHFDNPQVAAAYGRQLPRKGANPIEAHARLFNYPEQPALRCMADARALGFKSIFFSNAFGAYRRSALTQVGGFPSNACFGEDTQTIAKMLLAGFKVAYAAEATVFHSHPFSIAEEFHRYRQVGAMHASEPWLEECFGGVSGEGLRYVRSELQYLARRAPHLWPMALVRSATKYTGYRLGKRKRRALSGDAHGIENNAHGFQLPIREAGLETSTAALLQEHHD